MTAEQFRKIALRIPGAIELSHMNHPDFRLYVKIFASLGAPEESWAIVRRSRVHSSRRHQRASSPAMALGVVKGAPMYISNRLLKPS
jgi:hypothetical protein